MQTIIIIRKSRTNLAKIFYIFFLFNFNFTLFNFSQTKNKKNLFKKFINLFDVKINF